MPDNGADSNRKEIAYLMISALFAWGRLRPKNLLFALRTLHYIMSNERRRRRQEAITGVHIPYTIAVSPTMRCNYDCIGCYSKGRRTDNEMLTRELDALLAQAEGLGVHVVVVTGGEPLLRNDIIDLMSHHKRLLFVLITNGSLMTPDNTRSIARSGNIVTLISLEGSADITDHRRSSGAHQAAVRAFQHLRKAGACFGFSATNTSLNSDFLASDGFVDSMTDFGCTLGYFVEYVPCGPCPRPELCLDEAMRSRFRQRVIKMDRKKRITLIQFPDDEYGPDNRCAAAGQASLHINPQGGVEPCPFVPIARDNIRNHDGLIAAFRSPFLKSIRKHPELLKRRRLACSLFENLAEVEKLSQGFPTKPEEQE